jgi:hypothetical protein
VQLVKTQYLHFVSVRNNAQSSAKSWELLICWKIIFIHIQIEKNLADFEMHD